MTRQFIANIATFMNGVATGCGLLLKPWDSEDEAKRKMQGRSYDHCHNCR